MIAVLFEAFPSRGKWDEYLTIAAELIPELTKIEGFISIERFQSISNPEKILSLSFWKDEESIMQWQNMELHRMAQRRGKKTIFDDYSIKIAAVVRDYGKNNRTQAPYDSKIAHR